MEEYGKRSKGQEEETLDGPAARGRLSLKSQDVEEVAKSQQGGTARRKLNQKFATDSKTA
jgi:hypothetical protein